MYDTIARPRQAEALRATAILALLVLLQALLVLLTLADLGTALRGEDPRWLIGMLGTLLLIPALAILLRHYARSLHFSWLYARWPGPVCAAGGEQGTLAQAARDAFLAGDWQRCDRVLERLDPARRTRHWRTAHAACLLNQGDPAAALAAYQAAPADRLRARWLRPRTWFWLWERRPYFTEKDGQGANTGWWRTAALAAVLLAGADVLVQGHLLWALLERAQAGFSGEGFKEEVSGDFVLHYHRRDFMQEVLPQAEAALAANLRFLGMSDDAFAGRPIHIYLCDSQKEYLARSPFTLPWEAASAHPPQNSIYMYPPGRGMPLDLLLAHELNHLAFYRMNPGMGQSSWLVEGLAEYVGYLHALEGRGYARDAFLKANKFKELRAKSLPFSEFLKENPRDSGDSGHISLFYLQGFSIVYVLIEYYGKKAFLAFMDDYAKNGSIQASLAKSYPTIKDADGLKAAWSLFMQNGG